MCEKADLDNSAKDEPQRYDKKWWQDFIDGVRTHYEDPEYRPPEPVVVRSLKDWDALDGRWSWPKPK